jgi:hypothetical protein
MWYFSLNAVGGVKFEAALANASACLVFSSRNEMNFDRGEEIFDQIPDVITVGSQPRMFGLVLLVNLFYD